MIPGTKRSQVEATNYYQLPLMTTTSEMDSLVNEVKRFTLSKDMIGLEDALNKLSMAEDLSSVDSLKDTFLDLLMHNTPIINLLVAKTIAEITKTEEHRVKFSNNEILEKLMELLNVELINQKQSENIELMIQLCRALGNIFYSNDDARNIIFHLDGGRALVNLFDVSIKDIQNANQVEMFSKVRSGVMTNYLLGNEELSQKAIELGIIDKIKMRIEESSDGLEHLLPIFSILTEQVSDLIFQPEILCLITKILKTSNNSEVVESCLELLQCQAESDEVKLLLAREGLCEHIFNSLEKYKNLIENIEAKSLVKLTCDLIVLILTGDDAMHFLDKTPLLSYMETWMESDDVDLMTTSVLALGNFARTDDHCKRMVEDSMHVKLIEILRKNNGSDADVRLQHALLSAIRNLVIPKQNKVAVIDAGLVETILPMLEIHQPPVVFKLLGTLRMIVDGQDALALEILQNRNLIELLVEWANKSPDMVGVNSESSRLMAWLIKNGYRSREIPTQTNADPLKLFVSIDGTVDTLIKMLLSAHLVMQNEALIALSLIVVFLKDQNVELNKILITSNIGQTLADFIQRISEMERTSNEIVENLKTLIASLEKSEELKKHLNENNIEEKLKTVPSITELATL